jgi:integrase
MTWQNIDLIGGNIVVKSADKGGLKKRVVPVIDQEFAELLATWLENDLADKKTPSDPVVTFNGKPIKTLKTAWNAAKKRARITRQIRKYDLRHSFATKLLDNGADLKHVSSLLGHKSVQQTVDAYQHLSRRMTEESM